jgi:hypothetical protein
VGLLHCRHSNLQAYRKIRTRSFALPSHVQIGSFWSQWVARPCIPSVFAVAQRRTTDTQPPDHNDRPPLAYDMSAAGNRCLGCLTLSLQGGQGHRSMLFGQLIDGTLHCCAPICLQQFVYATSVLPSCHSHNFLRV